MEFVRRPDAGRRGAGARDFRRDRSQRRSSLELCHALSAVHQAGPPPSRRQSPQRHARGRRPHPADGFRCGPADTHPNIGRPTSDSAGTILYLAPEILEGPPATRQSDVYSLGVLLFHLVTGRYPLDSMTLEAVRLAHAQQRRHWLADLRPDLPEPFVRIVERAIAADPQRRFETAGALAADLTDSLGGIRVTDATSPAVEPPADAHRGGRPAIRANVWVAGGVAALLAIASGSWILTDRSARDDARRGVSEAVQAPAVAVMPFADLGGDPGQADPADGVTDGLVGRLSRNPGLRVISAGSSGSPRSGVRRCLRTPSGNRASTRSSKEPCDGPGVGFVST